MKRLFRSNALLSLYVCLAMLLAGCSNAARPQALPAGSEASTVPDAPAATVTPDTGSITGTLTDPEFVPVANARIFLVQNELGTNSDGAGRFTLNSLAPGLVTLAIGADGYEETTRKVTVVAGEVTVVSVFLTPIPTTGARSRTFEASAFIELGASAVYTSLSANASGTDRLNFFYRLEPDAVSAVDGVKWVASSPGTAKRLFLSLRIDYPTCFNPCNKDLNTTRGVSPLHTRSDRLSEEMGGKAGYRLNTRVGLASCGNAITAPTNVQNCTAAPDAAVQVAYQQRLTVYTSVFFVVPAPRDFSPIPPS